MLWCERVSGCVKKCVVSHAETRFLLGDGRCVTWLAQDPSGHASDIHIEANAGDALTAIRFRRDGELEPHLNVPTRLRAPLVSRIKIMAKLDITERRCPQDREIDFLAFGGKALELRVAVMPTHDGLEDVVLRLLESAKPLPLRQVQMNAKIGLTFANAMRGFLRADPDIILMIGRTQRLPPGAGVSAKRWVFS